MWSRDSHVIAWCRFVLNELGEEVLTREEVEELIEQADQDGDGRINYIGALLHV